MIAANEETCQQLIDLVKFGPDKYCWLLAKVHVAIRNIEAALGPQPRISSIWNPHNVSFYDEQVEERVCGYIMPVISGGYVLYGFRTV